MFNLYTKIDLHIPYSIFIFILLLYAPFKMFFLPLENWNFVFTKINSDIISNKNQENWRNWKPSHLTSSSFSSRLTFLYLRSQSQATHLTSLLDRLPQPPSPLADSREFSIFFFFYLSSNWIFWTSLYIENRFEWYWVAYRNTLLLFPFNLFLYFFWLN